MQSSLPRRGAGAFAPLGLLALVACGAPQSPRPTPQVAQSNGPNATPPPRTSNRDVPAAPSGLAVTVRIANPGALAERLGRMLGSPEAATGAVDGLLSDFLHVRELTGLVDRAQSVDFVVVLGEQHTEFAISVAMGAPEQVENAVGQRFRFVDASHGVLRLESVAQPEEAQGQDPQQRRPRARGRSHVHCGLVPLARSEQSRMVCFERGFDADVAAWLGRGLGSTAATPDTVRVDVNADALRARWGSQALQGLDQALSMLPGAVTNMGTSARPDSPVRNAQVQQLLVRLGTDLLGEARALVNESAAFTVTARAQEDRVVLRTEYDLRNPSGSLARAVASALGQPAPTPPALLNRLLPGAQVYVAGSVRSEPLVPWIDRLIELAQAVLHAEHALPDADLAALRAALEGGLHNAGGQGIAASGSDDAGRHWTVSTRHHATEAEAQASVAATRALFTALRRPAVARAIDHALDRVQGNRLHLRDVRDLPGVPAGGWGLRVPAPEWLMDLLSGDPTRMGPALDAVLGRSNSTPPSPPTPASATGRPAAAQRGRPAAGAPAATPTQAFEMLVVQEGADVHTVFGPGAVALYNRFHGNAQPGVDVALLDTTQQALVEVFVPRAFVLAARQRGQRGFSGGEVERFLASQDGGRTPIVVRIPAVSVSDGLTRFAMELEVQSATLGAIGAAVNGGRSGGSAPPPTPAPAP